MSTHILRKTNDPIELLERMLNKTTLSTQRVSHKSIVDSGEDILQKIITGEIWTDLGDTLVKKSNVDLDGEKQKAVDEALEAADRRHAKELKTALRRQQKELDAEKNRAMDRQKANLDDLAKRVAVQRDKMEEESIRKLTRKLEQEKEDALQKQKDDYDARRQDDIDNACAALTRKLRNEFALEKEKAIAESLARAREKFKIREQETIARTQRECEQTAAEEAARVAEKHSDEMRHQQERYSILCQKYQREMAHKQRVENDFQALQLDYQRFMNYTDGHYNSDYMMRLRKHGGNIAQKKISTVTYDGIEPKSVT